MDAGERERIAPFLDTILQAAEAAGVGIAVGVDDGDGAKVLYASPRVSEINGRSIGETVGQPATVFVAPEQQALTSQVEKERQGGNLEPRLLELNVLRPDGTRVPVEIGLSYAPYQGRTAFVAFMRDVSERRRSMEALQRSEASFRRLIESAPEAIAVQREGTLLYANPALVSLLGVPSANDLVGKAIADVLHPDDRLRFLETVQKRGGNGGQPYEYRIVRPDGDVRMLDVVAIAIEFEGAPAVLGFARDVTERNRLRAQVMEADRLAAMGTLAAGVGHEINNPLAYALLNLQALERQLVDGVPREREPSALEMVCNALAGLDRVRTIARDLKAFSRSDPDTRTPLDVRHVLESAINMTAHEIKQRAELVTHFEESPFVMANEARLGQVFLNLLVNAAHALPEHASARNEVRVTLRPSEGEDRVIVDVADNGVGIPENLRERIFEPYFTTKPLGMGTGLGLWIARGIVTSFGGTLTAHNAPQGGAVLRVTLPALTLHVKAPSEAPATPRPVDRLRVLIVEDEPALATALQRSLQGSHEVVVAPGGGDALDVLSQGPPFDAILCDLMMTDMTGKDLFEEVRGRLPHLADRFVFMTGGAQSPELYAFLTSYGRPWLEKPFEVTELLDLLAQVYAERR